MEHSPGIERIVDYYTSAFDEAHRLGENTGPIEWIRSLDILGRCLPPPPAVVLDVGGGAGPYSRWLLERGYATHLVDLVPLDVEQARVAMGGVAEFARRCRAQESSRWSANVGDARSLEFGDAEADAVLLMGPLYHLPDPADRLRALGEARRVLKPGGVVVAAAISRFVSLIGGLSSGFLADPAFRQIVSDDLETGRHENPTGDPRYFTTAYFHAPLELADELRRAGFEAMRVVAVEGALWAARDWSELAADGATLRATLDFARRVESEPSLLGMSPHLMCVGRNAPIAPDGAGRTPVMATESHES
jgi:SAM-dependent methyltransferase